jgi:succinate dehydrogenase flavin-adding protein (antitoxin of CptAB toxin-antitoxin module)
MVKAKCEGDLIIVEFTDEEAKELKLPSRKKFELIKAREGIWLMVPHEEKKANVVDLVVGNDSREAIEKKITNLIKTLSPRDKMEGWFEKKLNENENKILQEMLKEGKIIKYKSSEVFRKALYALPKNVQKKQVFENKFQNMEKPKYDYTLEKDGFMVIKNELNAKTISEQLKEKIKAGEIRGLRSFEGDFYVINSVLLQESEKKVLEELSKEKQQTLSQLSSKTNLTPTLVKISMEFLKEDGEVMERKKEVYQYIK